MLMWTLKETTSQSAGGDEILPSGNMYNKLENLIKDRE